VLSGRGLCDELITRPEESYRQWRVVVCDKKPRDIKEAIACTGLQSQTIIIIIIIINYIHRRYFIELR
jgi:hypothetical protein